MNYKKVFDRRTLLRGAGTIAIGLPFVDAMRSRSVYAADPEPPVRALNVFFGLGVPLPLQTEGLAGPLEPYTQLQDKLCILRGVDQYRVDEPGINAHFDGAAGSFTAEKPIGEALTGGPSVDSVLKDSFHPNGTPAGLIPSLLMGTYFRRSRRHRYVHSWGADGSPSDLPMEDPVALFDRIFGQANPGDPTDPVEARRLRIKRSVLDSVVAQYQHYKSPASNLGQASRSRISDHLERIREYETRVFQSLPEDQCPVPVAPGESEIPHGATADPGGEGIDITVRQLRGEWRLMSDLYALAFQCDRTRFGAATFLAGGERIRLSGEYRYDGRLIYNFDDRGERGRGGSLGCSHEFWHEFREANANTQIRAHIHFMMNEVVYLLQQLDDPNHPDENGKTILENALLTVSTESADGRHNDIRRELTGVFHAVSGANDRVATGQILETSAEGLDVYNTLLSSYDIPQRMGPAGRAMETVSGLLR